MAWRTSTCGVDAFLVSTAAPGMTFSHDRRLDVVNGKGRKTTQRQQQAKKEGKAHCTRGATAAHRSCVRRITSNSPPIHAINPPSASRLLASAKSAGRRPRIRKKNTLLPRHRRHAALLERRRNRCHAAEARVGGKGVELPDSRLRYDGRFAAMTHERAAPLGAARGVDRRFRRLVPCFLCPPPPPAPSWQAWTEDGRPPRRRTPPLPFPPSLPRPPAAAADAAPAPARPPARSDTRCRARGGGTGHGGPPACLSSPITRGEISVR